MNTASVVMWVTGAAAVTVAVFKVRHGLRRRDVGQTYLAGAVGFVGVSAAVSAPGTIVAGAAVEPFPNATRLLANSLAMVAAFCVHGMLAHLVHDGTRARRAVRWQATVLLAGVGAMTVLLGTADIPADPDFVHEFADEPAVAAYVVVFAGYIAAGAGGFIRLIRRHIAASDRFWLRTGLTVVQVGAAVGIGWAVVKTTAAMCTLAGRSLGIESVASTVLSSLCVLLVTAGIALCAWGPSLGAPVRWVRLRRQYRALYPLWKLLVDALPDLSADRTLAEIETRSRDVPWKLSRRVVTIRDGLLFVAPYRDPAVAVAAREAARQEGVRGVRQEAVIEAARVSAAARDCRDGRTPTVAEPEAPSHRPTDFTAEVDWLVAVARACRRPLPHPGTRHEAGTRPGLGR